MLQALRDEVIVEPVFEEKKGTLFLPRGRGEYNQYSGFIYGLVLSVGSRYPYEVNPGDKILFMRHEGKRIIYDRKLYLALKEKWVDCLIRD